MTIESDLIDQRNRLQDSRARLSRLETITTVARTLHSELSSRVEYPESRTERRRTDAELVAAFDRFLALGVPGSILDDPLTDLPFPDFTTAITRYLGSDRDPIRIRPSRIREFDLEEGHGRDPTDIRRSAERRHDAVAVFEELLNGTQDTRKLLADRFESLLENTVEERNATRERINHLKATHVETLRRADREDIDPMSALEWEAPIAMFPVRLETRFVDEDGGVDGEPVALRIRVYPEQIHVDSHEPELTDRERTWGRQFWAQLWLCAHSIPSTAVGTDALTQSVYDPQQLPADLREPVATLFEGLGSFSTGDAQRFVQVRERAWTRGVEAFGSERAAWIIHALGPVTASGESLTDTYLDGFEAFGSTAPPALRFPSIPDRPESWSQQPRARLLPDRWQIRAHWTDDSGTDQIAFETSAPVAEPLHVAPDPTGAAADAQQGDTVAGAGVEWMIDYQEAEAAGMAVTLDLPEELSLEDGFSLLEVTGVRTSTGAASGANAVEDLLAAHQYTDGFSFLSAGTPTNNADEPSGYASHRQSGEGDDTAASPPVLSHGDGSDGDRTARALGIGAPEDAPHVFGHIAGAGATRSKDAAAVQRLLWPATLGYYAENLFLPWEWSVLYDDEVGVDDRSAFAQELSGSWVLSWLGAYREHFTEFVRADGPLGTVRTGRQPYGILPVSPLDVEPGTLPRRPPDERPEPDSSATGTEDWEPATLPLVGDGEFLQGLIEYVWGLRETWLSASNSSPNVGEDTSTQTLLDALGREAVASEYRRRSWLVDSEHPAVGTLVDGDQFDTTEAVASNALSRIGIEAGDVRLDRLLWLGATATSEDLAVVDPGIDEFAGLLAAILDDASTWSPLNPFRVLGTDQNGDSVYTAIVQLLHDWVIGRYRETGFEEATFSLDESLLRQLLLLAVERACVSTRVRLGTLYGDPVSVGPEPTAYRYGDRTVYDDIEDRIDSSLVDHSSLSSDSTYQEAIGVAVTDVEPPIDPPLSAFASSLDRIASDEGPDTDALDRLVRGSLDLCSHRLDAWWTSIATRRLQDVRQYEQGLHVGAYSYVTDLAPDPETESEYLLAPSQNQATTASILRNGQKANTGTPHEETLSVDLSADRIRRARPYLSGVRNGASLAELVGYRFERGLHAISDDPDNGVSDAEQYIASFRLKYSSLAGRLHGGAEPTDASVSGVSDVVDGLRLYREWKRGAVPWSEVLPEADPVVRTEIEELLSHVHDEMDALNDIFTAEGIHQLAKGNPERANAALSAFSRGEMPSNLEVLETPRTETGVTHRLMVLFGDVDSAMPPSAWETSHRNLLSIPDLPDVIARPTIDIDRLDDLIDRPYFDLDRFADLDEGTTPDSTTLESIPIRPTGEPALNAWVGNLLPDPSRVGCPALYRWRTERSFETGTLDSPGGPQTVTVEVGFEPDLLKVAVVTPNERVTEAPVSSSGGPGWIQGVAHRRADGTIDQQSLSVTAGGSEISHTTSSSAVLHGEVRTGDGTTGTVTAIVEETTETGFELRFTSVDLPEALTSVSVEYTATKTGDTSAISVGSFVAEPPAEADLDDGTAATQIVDLGVDADYVDLTATSRASTPDSTGTSPTSGGLSRGTLVSDDALSQYTSTVAMDPATGDGAHAVANGCVLELLYPTGGSVGERTRARASSLTGSELELTYEHPDPGGTDWNQTPRLVTYVAVEAAIHETTEGVDGGPPAIGVETVSTTEDRVRVDTDERLGRISVRAIPDVPLEADGTLSTAPALTVGESGWSEGMATGSLEQVARGYATADGHTAGHSSDQHIVTLPRLDSDGSVVGSIEGTLREVDETGFTIEFGADEESLSLASNEGIAVVYTAWPVEPTERAFAVTDACTVDELDLSPLDAISFAAGTEDASAELEARIAYRLFRTRPANDPPIPVDADLELEFGEAAPTTDVSLAAFLELARAVYDLLGDGRPTSARDLTHPSAAEDNGYLPDESSVTTDPTAEDLATRADDIEQSVERIKTALDNRLAVLEAEPGPTLNDMADRIADAVEALGDAAPLAQVVEAVKQLAAYATPDANADSLVAELLALADALPVGPTELSRIGRDDPIAGTDDQEISVETTAAETNVTVTVGSTSTPAFWETWDTTTDEDGHVSVTADLDGLPSGTGLLVSVVSNETLPDRLESVLERLDPDEQRELLIEAVDREIDESIRNQLRSYTDLSRSDREALLEDLPPRVLEAVLGRLGLEDIIARRPPFGRPRPPRNSAWREVLTTRSLRIVPETDSTRPVETILDEDLRIVPGLLWVRRLLDILDPSLAGDESGAEGASGSEVESESEAAALAGAVADADWQGLRAEASLVDQLPSIGAADTTAHGAVSRAERQALQSLLALETHQLDKLATAIDDVLQPLERVGLTTAIRARGPLEKPWEQRHTISEDSELESPLGRGVRGELRDRIESRLAVDVEGLPASFTGFTPSFREFLATEVDDPVAVGRAIAALVRAPAPVVDALDEPVEEPHLLVRDLLSLASHPEILADHGEVSAFETRLSNAVEALAREESRIGVLFRARVDVGEPERLIEALETAVPELTTHALHLTSSQPSYGASAAQSLATAHDEALDHLVDAVKMSITDYIRPAVDGPHGGRALRKTTLETLRHALVRASYLGIYGSTPESPTGGTMADQRLLVRQARAVTDELGDRLAEAEQYDPTTVADEPTVDGQIARIQALLGEEFVVLPTFAPTNGPEIGGAFANTQNLLGDDPYAVDSWLQRIARVRRHPSTYRDVRTYTDAFALSSPEIPSTSGDLTVAQLGGGSTRWVGRDDTTPDGGELSLVAEFASIASETSPIATTPGRNGQPPLAGFLIDEWVDSTPATEETLGVGLQYDDPGTRAPQSMVLAVPPAWEREDEGWTATEPLGWTREGLETTLEETRDLVAMRGVDLDDLEEFGHLLPGLVFPYNDTTVGQSVQVFPDAPSVEFDLLEWFDGGDVR